MATDKNPKTVTVYGRLSFPAFTAAEAHARNAKGDYPSASEAEAKPDFSLLLEQAQFDKLMTHIEDEFLPYCIKQNAAGEKRDSLDAKEVKKLLDGIKNEMDDQTYNTPIKAINEKTLALAPECMAAVKCIGNAGTDITLKAIVRNEDELAVPDPDIMKFPVVLPLNQTVHTMYPGAYVAVTINLYAYHNGKNPGFSAGVSTAVFRQDADRFGGGVDVDVDEMFMD